jgi:hypothetical protein
MIRLILIYLIIGFVFSLAKAITDPHVKAYYGFEKGKQPTYGRFLLWIVAISMLWPLGVWFLVEPFILEFADDWADKQAPRDASKPFQVKPEHLIKACILEEIEAEAMVYDPLGFVPNKPFGHLNGLWVAFRDDLPEDARLWSFKAQWGTTEWNQALLEGFVVSDGRTIGPHVVVKRRAI